MTEPKTLFVKVSSDHHWDVDQLEDLRDKIDDITDDAVSVILTTDDIEYLTEEQVESFAENILSALDGAK